MEYRKQLLKEAGYTSEEANEALMEEIVLLDIIMRSKLLESRRSPEEELFVQVASSGTDLQGTISSGQMFFDIKKYSADTWYEALQCAAQDGHVHMVSSILQILDVSSSNEILYVSSPNETLEMKIETLMDGLWPWRGSQMTFSPVHLAVIGGHQEVVQALLHFILQFKHPGRLVPRWYPRRYWFQGLVEWAVKWGHAPIVQFIPRLIPKLLGDKEGEAILPFHLAAHHNHVDVLQVLLHHIKDMHGNDRANCHLLSRDGLTALHVAAQSGSLSAMELLLKETIDLNVNARSRPDFFTPLHMASNSGQLQVVHFLLQLASSKLVLVDDNAASDCARLDLEAQDCMGRTALHYATREGHESVVKKLLDHASEVQSNIARIADYDGLLPLHMAARAGHLGCIKALKAGYPDGISRKAKDSIRMKQRVEWEYMQSRAKLMADEYKANIYYGDKEANVYYREECRFPRPKVIDSFFWRTADFTPLHFAASYGHEAAMTELQADNEGINVDQHTEDHLQGREILPCTPANKGKASSSIFRSRMDVDEEKKALEEVHTALAKGIRPPLRMQIVQWLEDKDIGRVREYWLLQVVIMGDLDSLRRLLRVFAEFQGAAAAVSPEDQYFADECEAVQINAVKRAFKEAIGLGIRDEDGVIARELLSQVPGLARHRVDAAALLKELLSEALAAQHSCFTAVKEIMLLNDIPELVSMDIQVAEQVKYILKTQAQPYPKVEDFMLAVVTQQGLAGASSLLRLTLQWAQKYDFNRLVEVIMDVPELKKGLYEDLQVYLDCANAILVGGVLIDFGVPAYVAPHLTGSVTSHRGPLLAQ